MATNPVAAQNSTALGNPETALSKLSGDYTMFLRLLTSQMQNQDPLDPMDTSQYTQQLVQYSQVEQSIQQTSALRDIVARLSSQDMIQTSALIGHDVSYASAIAGLGAETPARWHWTAQRAPASLIATISDASGKIVSTQILPEDASSLTWGGQLETGTQAAPGAYSLTLEARDANNEAIATNIEASGRIEAVSSRDGTLSLSVSGVVIAADALRDVTLPLS